MINGVEHLYKEKESIGIATISKFKFEHKKDPLFNLRAIRDGGDFMVNDGKYVRLHVDGVLMMSDTDMEKRSNREFVQKANGKVLIAGLGIGLILPPILEKENVSSVIVIEKYADVITLVGDKFKNKKLSIINADIFEYKPEEKFDTIYFDIWSNICEDNLQEIRLLHNRFKNKLNRSNPDCWMNSWMKEFLQRQKKKNSW